MGAEEKKQHTAGVGTPTYTAPEVCKGESYDNKADAWSAGVVLMELFMGQVTEAEKDKEAFRHIEETTQKLGDKPVPMMLKSLLTVDPTQRWSCSTALRSAAFEKLAAPEIMTFDWPEFTGAVEAPRDLLKDVVKFCSALEVNGKTERAAREYVGHVPEAKQAALCAVLLASRMFGSETYELLDIPDWDDATADFDQDNYLKVERQILEARGYELLLPPVSAAKGPPAKRTKTG